MRFSWRIGVCAIMGLVLLAGCGSETAAPQTNPPAVVEAAPTASGSNSWPVVERTANGLTYSYRYPGGWTSDLFYCAPGAARSASGNELPARCASTDILVGQKASDIVPLRGGAITNLIIDGKQAQKQIDDHPRNGMASRIYTVMVFDGTGQPLVGFATSIGPGTDAATQNNITAALDNIAATLTVGR